MALGLALASGCGSKPPPKEPEPEPITKWEPPKDAPKPPPPKCESLGEGCKGEKDKKAKVAKTSLAFVVPGTWVYAMLGSHTLAQRSDDGAVVALVGVEIPDPKKDAATKTAEYDLLAKELNVALPKFKKIDWKKKPDDKKEIAGTQLSFWQIEGALRGGKKGTVLLAWGARTEGKGLLGIGFVPDDDGDSAGVILQAFESLTVGP